MKKILIVEDEVLISEELRSIIMKLGHKVCGVVYNGDHVSDKVVNTEPDLVLLDINILGTKDGIDVGLDLNKRGVPFAYISSYSDSKTIDRVKASRPVGYLIKPFTREEVNVLLEMAFFRIQMNRKERLPSLELINTYLDDEISNTEYAIMEGVFDGLTNTQLSSQRFVSVNTVKSHIRNIYRKFGVNSKTTLIKRLLSMRH